MSEFKGRHFRGEIVLWAVRWYCRYAVSYRDLEAMMTERGVAVDHCTIDRWVQRFAPELEKRLRWQWRRPQSASWRIDETYVKVRGKWAYLYRHLHQRGPFQKCRRRRWLDRASVVGKHRPHERRDCPTPVQNPPHRRVERVFRPPRGQHEERPAFLQMPGGRTLPVPGRPALRLKSRMQLSDVVKERQGGESPARRLRQCSIRRRFQSIADNGQLQHSREHRRHVHGVMSEEMKPAAVLVGLAPGLKHHSQVICGIAVVLIET